MHCIFRCHPLPGETSGVSTQDHASRAQGRRSCGGRRESCHPGFVLRGGRRARSNPDFQVGGSRGKRGGAPRA
jgi:hypothetical protein